MCVCAYLTTTCFNENASAANVTSKQEINSGSGLLSETTISAQEKTWIRAGSKHFTCVSASLAADNTDNKSESQFFNKKCTYKINGLFNNEVRLFCLINQNFSWCSVLSNFHKFICVCIVQTLASFQQRRWCVHICKKNQYVWYYTYNISCWIFWTHSGVWQYNIQKSFCSWVNLEEEISTFRWMKKILAQPVRQNVWKKGLLPKKMNKSLESKPNELGKFELPIQSDWEKKLRSIFLARSLTLIKKKIKK